MTAKSRSVRQSMPPGGSCQPTDLVGAVREDAGGLREPIDDLVEMDGVTGDGGAL